jgi:Resolvase, N terminal domain
MCATSGHWSSSRRGLGTNELVRTRGGKTPHRDGTARRHRDVPRVSRMARSTLQVLEMLEHCARCGITVHVAKQKMVLDGSMQSHITATVLGLAAEIEREFISLRTSEAMARRKAQGLASVGRKVACPRGLSSMPRKRRSATTSVRRSGSAQLPSWWAARPRRSMNGWPVAISGHGNARRPSGGLLQQWPHPSKMGKWAH